MPLPFGRNPGYIEEIREIALERCRELAGDARWAYLGNKLLANVWGILHLILGAVTTVLSSLSAILIFYENPSLVATISSLAAISAALLTFLNPSLREVRRRTIAENFKDLENAASNSMLRIKVSNSDQDILKEVEELSLKFESRTNKSLKMM